MSWLNDLNQALLKPTENEEKALIIWWYSFNIWEYIFLNFCDGNTLSCQITEIWTDAVYLNWTPYQLDELNKITTVERINMHKSINDLNALVNEDGYSSLLITEMPELFNNFSIDRLQNLLTLLSIRKDTIISKFNQIEIPSIENWALHVWNIRELLESKMYFINSIQRFNNYINLVKRKIEELLVITVRNNINS